MISFSRGYWLAIAAALVAAAAVATSISLNPPDEVRKHKFDEIRVEDLNSLRRWINEYWNENHKSLPPNLAALAKNASGFQHREHDPETGAFYAYEITGRNNYKLCAVFSLAADNDRYCCSPNDIGQHDVGKSCYSTTIK